MHMYVNIRFMHTYMCAHMGSIYGDAYFLSGCAVNFNLKKKKVNLQRVGL